MLEDAIPLARKRDRQFVAALVAELAHAPALNDEVLIAAAQAAYGAGCLQPAAKRAYWLSKAKEKLQLTSIGAAIADYYGTAANFTLADATKLHVEHIRGVAPEKANYQALKDFLTLTLPRQPKQVQVDQRSISARFNFTGTDQPMIDATPIALEEKTK